MATLPLTTTKARDAALFNPVGLLRSLWSHRELTLQLAARNIKSKYKGQAFGAAWSLLDPLMLLAIYTFVFGVVFHRGTSETASEGGIAGYALRVFAGILIFGVFRETVGGSPSLIIGHRNFVKKVVYPLETLPVSQLLVALFNLGVGLIIWILGYLIFSPTHTPSVTLLLLPLILLPVVLISLGLSWLLASLGVFLRDLKSPVSSIIQMLFFMSAIFYRIEDVPEPFSIVIKLNPMAQLVDSGRNVMFGDAPPHWGPWAAAMVAGVVLCLGGYAFFMKSRRAFADVI